ncbi:histidine kinase [Pyxidicoccus fallax]|uniref:histidine kinase n=1 Tax=Pyxidicoccus fallax TaxID=394095 RepID=A0A848LYX1_9BACT|nr:ATP-binding protein [Pyxidicoccus fallax]NMO22732.1 histidine kinase [Pyxidicoccus fallax]NPC84910.1 histidine kinase [Pyxidicoccus fallax]
MPQTPRSILAEADPEQVHKAIRAIGGLGPAVTNLALIVWYWGDWRVVLGTVAVGVCLTVTNSVLVERLASLVGRPLAETLRMLVNTGGIAVGGYLTHWSPLVWLFVPYNMLWFYGLDAWARPRMAVYLALVNGLAWWGGADPALNVAFTLFGVFGYLLSERRDVLFRNVLRRVLDQQTELQQAHARLQQMHQRALEQEKLSSLGTLAAGVAHEINNPMSFVTSNVDSLLRELRDTPGLPPHLQEYVDDALPATLDGIRRVNAIVTDLRRFARGDAEAPVAYELDGEVRAALRIVHGQLSHCAVETDLGDVGTLFGRPRQIVQVLVNLLANAGQATRAGGRIRVTTCREGDAVRVAIQDTGEGMSPETLKRLFQPFFTTKAPGSGTGLGLAVAHGIITSHGGRIDVESRPGEGSCFTLHLPAMLPRSQEDGGPSEKEESRSAA